MTEIFLDRLAPKVLFVLKACLPKTRWAFYSSHLISCYCWLGRAPYERQQVLSIHQTSSVAQLEKWQALHNIWSCKNYKRILNPVEKISICVDWIFFKKKIWWSRDPTPGKTPHHKTRNVLCIAGSVPIKEEETKQSKQNDRIYRCANFVWRVAILNAQDLSNLV